MLLDPALKSLLFVLPSRFMWDERRMEIRSHEWSKRF